MKPIIGITGDIEDRNGRTYFYIDLRYGKMVEEVGGVPMLLHPYERVEEMVSMIDGLVLSGGEDIHPRYYGEEPRFPMNLSPDLRTEFEIELIREGMRKGMPVLGICHGMQIMNVVFGGTLYQDLPSQRADAMDHMLGDKRHPVFLEKGSRLFGIVGKGEIEVTSTHHQAIKELGDGLKVCAVAEDGIVEAFERPDYPYMIGVQWHPEKEPDGASVKLFADFVGSCK